MSRPVRAEIVAAIARLDPPAESANAAFRRLRGDRAAVLRAFKLWRESARTDDGRTAEREAAERAAAERERARVAAWWSESADDLWDRWI